MFEWSTLALVAVVGGGASVLRLVFSKWQGLLPWGVLLANTIAAFIVGVVQRNAHAAGYGFGAVGPLDITLVALCGGLSTFSSVAAAIAEYWRFKAWRKGFAYLALSLVIPFTAVLAGAAVGRLLLN